MQFKALVTQVATLMVRQSIISKEVQNMAGVAKRCDNTRKQEHKKEGNGNLLQCSCLENPMDRRAWRAPVHGVAKESDITYWLNGKQLSSMWKYGRPVLAQRSVELHSKNVWNSCIWFQKGHVTPSLSLIESNDFEESCPHESSVFHQFYARDDCYVDFLGTLIILVIMIFYRYWE